MRVATIVPIPHLGLTRGQGYHLALAHLVQHGRYRTFFQEEENDGAFVIMDNGVVETGTPQTPVQLLRSAELLLPDEVILPDALLNRGPTLEMGERAMEFLSERLPWVSFMAVPQGETRDEWISCVLEMIYWPVACIGLSRFLTRHYRDRASALMDVPDLVESKKDIHLLGCPGDLSEFRRVEKAFPGRIRGVDSGIAAICAQEGIRLETGFEKPKVDLHFELGMNESLLADNIKVWREAIP